MNIYQALDIKLRNSTKNDKSRIVRNIRLINNDIELLKDNYSDRLYKMLITHWRTKMLKEDYNNFEDKEIPTHILNKFIAMSRTVRTLKDKNIRMQKNLAKQTIGRRLRHHVEEFIGQPNNSETRAAIADKITPEFVNLYNSAVFNPDGSISFER